MIKLTDEQRQAAERWASTWQEDAVEESLYPEWDAFDEATLFQVGLAAQKAIDSGAARAVDTAHRFLAAVGRALLAREAEASPVPRVLTGHVAITIHGLTDEEIPVLYSRLKREIKDSIRNFLRDRPCDVHGIHSHEAFDFAFRQEPEAAGG